MLSREQTATMLLLQGNMNAKVDPNWVHARYPYLRAVAIEGAEAMDQHGWKWWKKQQKDLPQLQLELIDIWHFILSEVLLRSLDQNIDPQQMLDTALQQAETQNTVELDGKTYVLDSLELLGKLELLIALSVVRRIELSVFAVIMQDCKMDWTELFRQYVGKNVLNMFRQDRGYKDGSYQKHWQGREDNEHLVDIIHRLDADSPTFSEAVYAELAEIYPD
ncbi:MAG: dUTP diphosphatase [Gammaproteobacteria bacterium]|nr:dUTP diphosphatase [Gammaproteobacteria bacterium]MCY4358447.1 dUTP diphosphatase [Gammaproteobacteria bacterium]